MNRNKQPREIGGLGDPPECTRDLRGERLSGLNRKGKEREFIEPISSRKTEHQMRERGPSHSHNFDP